MLERLLITTLILTLASCVVAQPKGQFVVEIQTEVNGNVYRDLPDVYDTLGDCIASLPTYVDESTLSIGCVVYQ